MRLLLDTQAFICAAFRKTAGKLPRLASKAIIDGRNELLLSAISIAELAILAEKKRLQVDAADIEYGLAKFRVRVLPVSADHLLRLFQLPVHHRDPFDRIIIAAALTEDLHLVGGGRQFSKYKGLKLIWD